MHACIAVRRHYGVLIYLAWYHKEKERKKGNDPCNGGAVEPDFTRHPKCEKKQRKEKKGKGSRFTSSPSNPSTYAHMHAYADEYGVHKT